MVKRKDKYLNVYLPGIYHNVWLSENMAGDIIVCATRRDWEKKRRVDTYYYDDVCSPPDYPARYFTYKIRVR
jgi:hypothetical protein